MNLSEDSLVQIKIAHLQMLQDVITRMANYSASIKNYTLTIGAALLAFFNTEWGDSDTLQYAVIPFIAFMILDARYLALERAFRNAYDKTRLLSPEQINFEITPAKPVFDLHVLKSWSISGFYLPLILIFLVIG